LVGKTTFSTEEIKKCCPFKPDELSACYDRDHNTYYVFSGGRWIVDPYLNNTDKLVLGVIRKLGQYYYVYDGVSQWVLFGDKRPVNGDTLVIRGSMYVYSFGKLDKITTYPDVNPNWEVFEKFYVEYILKHYASWEVFYKAWIHRFQNDRLAQEGYKVLEQFIGMISYLNLIRGEFNKKYFGGE
jgi:hypothetical protein